MALSLRYVRLRGLCARSVLYGLQYDPVSLTLPGLAPTNSDARPDFRSVRAKRAPLGGDPPAGVPGRRPRNVKEDGTPVGTFAYPVVHPLLHMAAG
eukprot:8663913-Pyramimonas_sp.AAC.2